MIKIEGYRSESVTLKAEDEICLKCKIAQLREQGFTIQYIDGKVVEGICEHCVLPVYEEQEYVSDNDGIYWHVGCEEVESSFLMEQIIHVGGPGSGIANERLVEMRDISAEKEKSENIAESLMIEPLVISSLYSVAVGPNATNGICISDSMPENRGFRFSMDHAIKDAGLETVVSNLTARLATDKELFNSNLNRLAPAEFFGESVGSRIERAEEVHGDSVEIGKELGFIRILEKALSYVNKTH